jgi:cytochrome o ubiquinol oxidase subunit 2
MKKTIFRRCLPVCFLTLPLLLGGCKLVVLNPAGDVAAQQRDLLVESTGLMLLIILPVMALIILFAWRYRASSQDAKYEPDWDHSTQLELLIWSAPLLIVICLGALTWLGTHMLDPYRKLGRIADGQAIVKNVAPLEVEVVALDWKWLFIYPQYGIATVGEMAAPLDRPIDFHITASSVMNSLFIPALAGQIYAMPGMETRLQAVINKAGTYNGFSANYSGAGFAEMNFAFYGLPQAGFDQWIAKVKADGGALDRPVYLELVKPSEKEPVHHYKTIDTGLYRAIVTLCVEPGPSCMTQMQGMAPRIHQASSGSNGQAM